MQRLRGDSRTGAINPGWFSLALRDQLALGTVCAPRGMGLPLRAHLRVSSHIVDVELLFTVLKLLWAIGVSKAERWLARRDTAIAGDVRQEQGRQVPYWDASRFPRCASQAIKTPLPPKLSTSSRLGGLPHLLVNNKAPQSRTGGVCSPL